MSGVKVGCTCRAIRASGTRRQSGTCVERPGNEGQLCSSIADVWRHQRRAGIRTRDLLITWCHHDVREHLWWRACTLRAAQWGWPQCPQRQRPIRRRRSHCSAAPAELSRQCAAASPSGMNALHRIYGLIVKSRSRSGSAPHAFSCVMQSSMRCVPQTAARHKSRTSHK